MMSIKHVLAGPKRGAKVWSNGPCRGVFWIGVPGQCIHTLASAKGKIHLPQRQGQV